MNPCSLPLGECASSLDVRRNRFEAEVISPNRMILHRLRPVNFFSIPIISVLWSVCASLVCSGVNCGDIFAAARLTAAGRAAEVLTMAGRATRPDANAVQQNFSSNETGAAKTSGEHVKAPTIVIGFVGGFVRRDNAVHSPVQIAVRLRSAHLSGVHVEVFENRRRQDAYRKILQLLDTAHTGMLPAAEKRGARIIIYGMSWGGSETLALARELKAQQIPVLLTIQVDSVAKPGENDEVIPANVAEAANSYQTNGLLHGRPQIRVEEQGRTRILGNFRYDYKANALRCEGYPWYDRVFTKYHTEIECDPAVWNRVEQMIREKLPPVQDKNALSGNAE
jgi:hypothetical protein